MGGGAGSGLGLGERFLERLLVQWHKRKNGMVRWFNNKSTPFKSWMILRTFSKAGSVFFTYVVNMERRYLRNKPNKTAHQDWHNAVHVCFTNGKQKVTYLLCPAVSKVFRMASQTRSTLLLSEAAASDLVKWNVWIHYQPSVNYSYTTIGPFSWRPFKRTLSVTALQWSCLLRYTRCF